MKHIKSFNQLNESESNIQDPKTVMSDAAFIEASKLRSMVNKEKSNSVENPVYFVVKDDGKELTIVIDEKFEQWMNATTQDKAIYYEEIVSPDEMEDYTLK